MNRVDISRLPKHIAIIMDGNGRWAGLRGMPRTVGHERGADAVRTTIRAARRLGISALTLYALSEQNWSRPKQEIAALIKLLCESLVSERDELIENGIRFNAVGRLHKLPPLAKASLDKLIKDTKELDGMTLTLALSYGAQEEIVDAVCALARHVELSELRATDIGIKTFEAELPSMEVGPVDLLIRTSGEQRISNFLMWGAAYAELYFTDEFWPDFNASSLCAAIAAFQQRDRRFGLTTESDSIETEASASDSEQTF